MCVCARARAGACERVGVCVCGGGGGAGVDLGPIASVKINPGELHADSVISTTPQNVI